MMKQYLSIKGQYPDAILFYRMGDFYEMFFEDAEIASGILEITLTSRNKNDDIPIPMCGVPHKAAKGYIARLIEAGRKVAVCDQVEDPAVAKGLVKREVVRVITPGMIIEDEFLEEKSNNFILAIADNQASTGLAYLDLSTGTFRLTEANDFNQIVDESQRLTPSEIILPDTAKKDPVFAEYISDTDESTITYLDSRSFDYRRARNQLLTQFQTVSLEGYGCDGLRAGIAAAGALLNYVGETQKQEVTHIRGLETYFLERFLWIDDLSCRNLELLSDIRSGSRQGTLLSIIDRTVTAMGGRMLKEWLRYPSIDIEEIEERLDAVTEVKRKQAVRNDLRELLKSVRDLERLGSKITMGQANARDLVALKRSLVMWPEIRTEVLQLDAALANPSDSHERLSDLANLIDRAVQEDPPPTIHEGGIIRSGYDPELDELVRISRDGKGWLAKLEIKEKEATGINALKVRYNKVFGYYLEVPKTKSAAVPAHYVRKQTLVNAERYITDELKEFESKVLNAEEQRAGLEYRIFNQIRAEVIENNPEIQSLARYIARLDCLLNLAEVADRNNYCRPVFNREGIIDIEDGRHPVIEKMIAGERFVPNSIRLDNSDSQVLIITGPNMAGKSTVLRQVALLVLMAHMGSFVPAARADVSVTDRIFTRVGALDNLSKGQSTFLVEMQETANILNNATAWSLVILDEIGRGTSTFDGLSIAWAVAEFLHDLHDQGVKTLFATHYHELTELAQTKKRVRNCNIAVKEWNDQIIFLRKLVEGGTNRSYGIQVARLAGIPEMVIQRAKKILADVQNSTDHLHHVHGMPQPSTNSVKEEMQLSLFQKPDHPAIEKLERIDISTMTPIEALNCLNDLQGLLKDNSN
jgi:DNA mismatch repair protein MutS